MIKYIQSVILLFLSSQFLLCAENQQENAVSKDEILQATLYPPCGVMFNYLSIQRRIELDYSLTKADLLAQLQDRLNGVDEDLLDQWDKEGRFDSREIDGATRYFSSSVSNLLFRYLDVRPLRKTPASEAWGRFVAEMVSEIQSDPPYQKLKPQQFHNYMSLTVNADAAKEGETLRCWLPIPQENAFQPQVSVIATVPAAKQILPSTTGHRAAYLEQAHQKGKPSEFTVEYSYISHPRITNINLDKVTDNYPKDIMPWLNEQPPHMMFIDELKEKTHEIIGGEQNPYWKAKKIYLWMSENFTYSYALEYSTLSYISQYCFEKKYGDCGQLALTYITMCRIAGVPARWETGWMLYPDMKNLHDWCTIYLPPYGWVPVDVNMGVEAQHLWTFLSAEEQEQITEFYFGSMDPYRMAANSNHGAVFDPPKTYLRSDTVDFQRGEVESPSRNIYYDEFDYSLTVLNRISIKQ